MSNPTLQAELEQIVHNLSGNLREASNEDDYADSISEALKAILATVSKHLPEKSGKESEIKNIYGSPLGERIDMRKFKTGGTTDYINGRNSGYNTAITEMEKTLGGVK